MIELTKKEYDDNVRAKEQLRILKNFIKQNVASYALEEVIRAMEEDKEEAKDNE